jgi:hypothetical protein
MSIRMLTDLGSCLTAAGIPWTPVGRSSLDPTGASDWTTRTRPSSAGSFQPRGILCHHTASPAGTSDQADLNVILAGNSEAPGPISQLHIGRSATVYVVAAGRANHGGSGKIPGESCADMNAALLGIEAGNNGVGERWPDAQTSIYARVVAALCAHYGWSIANNVFLHATTGPACGNYKIDPAGPWQMQPTLTTATWDLTTWRNFVAAQTGSSPGPAPGPSPTPPSGGSELALALIIVDDAYAKFAGDMDAQGVVNTVRYLGARINNVIGFQPDNVTPRLAGTQVLHRKQATMNDFTLVGPLPKGDKVTWTAANFYQGD